MQGAYPFFVNLKMQNNYFFNELKIIFFLCSEFDLYSKGDTLPDIDALKPYYQSLIDKYCPGKLKW